MELKHILRWNRSQYSQAFQMLWGALNIFLALNHQHEYYIQICGKKFFFLSSNVNKERHHSNREQKNPLKNLNKPASFSALHNMTCSIFKVILESVRTSLSVFKRCVCVVVVGGGKFHVSFIFKNETTWKKIDSVEWILISYLECGTGLPPGSRISEIVSSL